MGVTIHYSGTIDRTEAIPQFAEELIAIADGLSEDEPLPEDASVDHIVARIEAIVKKLKTDGHR